MRAIAGIGCHLASLQGYYQLLRGKEMTLSRVFFLHYEFLAIINQDNYQLQTFPLIISQFVFQSSSWLSLAGMVATALVSGSLSPAAVQTVRRGVMLTSAVTGAGMTIYYIKDMPEKREEKGVLVAMVALFALEGCLAGSSRCVPLRVALGVGTSVYGIYFRAKSLKKVE